MQLTLSSIVACTRIERDNTRHGLFGRVHFMEASPIEVAVSALLAAGQGQERAIFLLLRRRRDDAVAVRKALFF